jgi:SAM-dependent methyltransferase
MNVRSFYDQLSPFYDLVYPDWERSIERQAHDLDAIIRAHWGAGVSSILDAACGIGTQALGLARLGYRVTGSDLSPAAVQRAQAEAKQRGLSIAFSVADMRRAFVHHGHIFDLVIACDNAVPHLLSDEEILAAFQQFCRCTRPGGGCLISVRDYHQVGRKDQVKLYDLREQDGIRYLLLQAWRFHGEIYDLNMYVIEDDGGTECKTQVMRTRYYAVSTATLIDLMERAGFIEVQRLDEGFFQPVLVGTRA